jgi:hypothetical protein
LLGLRQPIERTENAAAIDLSEPAHIPERRRVPLDGPRRHSPNSRLTSS